MTTAHNKNHSEQIKAMVAGGGNGQSEPALTDDAGKALLGTLLTEFTKQTGGVRSEEHTSELQSHAYLVCRLLLEKKKHV